MLFTNRYWDEVAPVQLQSFTVQASQCHQQIWQLCHIRTVDIVIYFSKAFISENRCCITQWGMWTFLTARCHSTLENGTVHSATCMGWSRFAQATGKLHERVKFSFACCECSQLCKNWYFQDRNLSNKPRPDPKASSLDVIIIKYWCF